MPLEGCPVCALYEAHEYLARLFKFYAPQCEPLPNMLGVCTQIDNLLVTLQRERAGSGAAASSRHYAGVSRGTDDE